MGTGVSSKYNGSDETDTSQDRFLKFNIQQKEEVAFYVGY